MNLTAIVRYVLLGHIRDRRLSYLGFIHSVLDSYRHLKKIKILEIGIDKGHSALPIIHNLQAMYDDFTYFGVDIKLSLGVLSAIDQMEGITFRKKSPEEITNVNLYEANSLSILPMMVEAGDTFDIIFLDGDHNYFTVISELIYLEKLSHKGTVIVCDDYFGRYESNDLFYSEREEYKSLRVNESNTPELNSFGDPIVSAKKATPVISISVGGVKKAGVKTAVDEFINNSNLGWNIKSFSDVTNNREVEAVILYQESGVKVENNCTGDRPGVMIIHTS